jgi:hypothetical protein
MLKPLFSKADRYLLSTLGSSSGFSLFSPQGLQWISERTGSDELIQFISTLLREARNCAPENATELWPPASPTERPTEPEPLPPREIADQYIQSGCTFVEVSRFGLKRVP